MAGVESDLRNYADAGLFDRADYIKVARKVNSDLGLKIYTENDAIIQVKDYKSTLPADFLYLQLAMACDVSYVKVPKIRGIQTEAHSSSEENVPLDIINPCDNKCALNECNGVMWVTQKIGSKTYKYEHLQKLSISKSSRKFCSDTCFNLRFKSPNEMHIDSDGETVHFSFREGEIYIKYLSDMVDGENNVLILDHPMVNDYYEYAIKKKFFENMELNKEGDFERDYVLVSNELRKARIEAINFINTPEYGEIIKIHESNRKRFYDKYVRYFDEYSQGIFRT
jgi:hypothetical protein